MNPDLMTLVSSFLGSVGGPSRRGLSPWAIRAEEIPASLQTVGAIRRPNVSGDDLARAASIVRKGESLAPGSFASRVGNVAIVPVYGPLVARFSWSYWSYEEIVRDLRLAEASGVDAILMEIDSPGGMVSGVDTVPAEVARIRERIPVHSHIRGIGASAAYWIAASGERITADRTSLVGSVGALIHYVDLEGVLSKLGASIVSVVADQSPNKRLDRNTEEGRAELQAIVNDGAEMFIEALASARGADRQAILDTYGQGLVFTSRDALGRGMIEAVDSMDNVLSGVAARPMDKPDADPAAVSPLTQETAMTDLKNTTAVAAVMTMATLKAENTALVSELHAEGAEQERKRIAGIEDHAAGMTGVEKLVGEMKADGKTTPEQAAGRLLAASKANLGERLKGMEAMDKAAEGITSTLSGGNNPAATVPPTPDGWTAEWNASTKLQDEYPTAESYVAIMKRKARAA